MIFETKAQVQVDDEGAISGMAWPWATADRVGDMVSKGAFAGAQMPVPMLDGHDQRKPIGVWTHLEETNEGLVVKGRLLVADVARAREVAALVKAGALGGLSIGFSTKKAITRKGGGRTITALDLVEISLVSVPCHPGARIRAAKNAANSIVLAEAIHRAASALKSKG